MRLPPPGTSRESTRKLPPVVSLRVTASDRNWVDATTLTLKSRIDEGSRQVRRANDVLLLGSLLLIVASVVVFLVSDDNAKGLNAGETVSVVLVALLPLALLLLISLPVITPQLELLPDGGLSKFQRL